MKEIFDFLREYEDLFPLSILEFKGIKGELWEMKIILKPNANLVKHQLYRLNPRVKEKVKKEINKMLATKIIFPVDKDEWVNQSVIYNKKDT